MIREFRRNTTDIAVETPRGVVEELPDLSGLLGIVQAYRIDALNLYYVAATGTHKDFLDLREIVINGIVWMETQDHVDMFRRVAGRIHDELRRLAMPPGRLTARFDGPKLLGATFTRKGTSI